MVVATMSTGIILRYGGDGLGSNGRGGDCDCGGNSSKNFSVVFLRGNPPFRNTQ